MENKSLTEIKVGEIAPTKFGLDLMACSISEQVADGNLNSLDVAIRMNAMEQLCKLVNPLPNFLIGGVKDMSPVIVNLNSAPIRGITISSYM